MPFIMILDNSFNGTLFSLKEWQVTVIQTWVFGRHFLKNKVSQSLQGEQVTILDTNDEILSFQGKIEIWKTCIYHNEFDSIRIFKDFCGKTGSNINKCYLGDII